MMMPAAAGLTGPIQGLQTDLFDGIQAPKQQSDTNANVPAPQAAFQAISVPVSSQGGAAASTSQTAKGSMQLGNKTTNQPSAPICGISFARKQDNGQVKQLGAKKLDIDFGGDDFFNSFQPAAAQDSEPNPFAGFGNSNTQKKTSNKLQEIDSDPFKLGSSNNTGSSSSATPSINMGYEDNGLSEKQAQERLRQLGNRKAISSADFENNDAHNAEMQSRFQALTGATQISSDMMFGTGNPQ